MAAQTQQHSSPSTPKKARREFPRGGQDFPPQESLELRGVYAANWFPCGVYAAN